MSPESLYVHFKLTPFHVATGVSKMHARAVTRHFKLTLFTPFSIGIL